MSDTVKVKREGPKGYHIIDREKYDPLIHELYDQPAPPKKEAVPNPPVTPKTSRSKK